MTSIYRYLFGSSTTASSTNGRAVPPLQIATDDAEHGKTMPTDAAATETTSLLGSSSSSNNNNNASSNNGSSTHKNGLAPQRTPEEQSATDFYFPPHNPTVQRYYRFTSTTLTPIAALHRRPGTANTPMATSSPGGVTGLLRRSAVVPSHGTDSASGGDWILVSVGGRSGWARTASNSTNNAAAAVVASHNINGPTGGFVPADRFRATEAWMGNHFFFCGGRYMLGSDAASLVMTNGLILVGILSHFVVFLPRLAALLNDERTSATRTIWLLDDPVPLFWTSFLLTILTFGTLWWTALTDPGILPPVSSPVKPTVPADGPLGGPLGYRYCSTCNIFRPPRSKHCNACNCCVSKFDHHCPWTGNCIGERNHRIFFGFLICLSLLSILVTAVTVRLLLVAYQRISIADAPGIGPVLQLNVTNINDVAEYGERTSHRLLSAMMSMPMTVLLGSFTFLSAYTLLSLLMYHAVIISAAQTTNERVRGVYRYGSTVNAADKGCCRNWYNVFCSSQPPSRLPLDFSAYVYQADRDSHEAPWKGETAPSNATARSSGMSDTGNDRSESDLSATAMA